MSVTAGRSALGALVGRVMTPGVVSVPADAPLRDAARAMARHHVHAVVVCAGAADRGGTCGDERSGGAASAAREEQRGDDELPELCPVARRP